MKTKHILWLFTVIIAGASTLFVPEASHAQALCAAQDMDGTWINVDPNTGSLYRIDIDFPCYDVAGASGPIVKIKTLGACSPTPCNWGEVASNNAFMNTSGGWPQYTRVNARYNFNFAIVDLVILLLANDRILIFSETEYTDGSGRPDYSYIDYMEPLERWIDATLLPGSPKQGDVLSFGVTLGDQAHLQRLDYSVGGINGSLYSPPFNISVNTCKETGDYITDLMLQLVAVYDDDEVQTFSSPHYDLTVGQTVREDQDRTFAFYVAEDPDKDFENRLISRANAFLDEFDSYDESQYHFAEPFIYTSQSYWYANSVDLAVSIGHGAHHQFFTGNGSVDLSGTAYGNLAPCYRTGDLEYLAMVSCQTLSMQDIGGESFWDYWFNDQNSRLEARPFTGLHQVLGFNTNVVLSYGLINDDGEDFLNTFAKKLDQNKRVRDAWMDAADEELSIENNKNRSAVLYLDRYENDRLSNNRNDYIFGNTNYAYYNRWIEHW